MDPPASYFIGLSYHYGCGLQDSMNIITDTPASPLQWGGFLFVTSAEGRPELIVD